ncbi:indole-3-glycerol phosphate synthase TrpC [Candidatus Hydrogenedentota bacterium]
MILDEIIAHKRAEVDAQQARTPLAQLRRQAETATRSRSFRSVLRRGNRKRPRLLAEIKFASPSEGVIRKSGGVGALAGNYEAAGASALSVLTDEKYFKGATRHLRDAKKAVSLPVLRKEFIISEYQIWESRAIGADAILLMSQILDRNQLKDMLAQSAALGMDVLVEGHTWHEIEKVVNSGATLIGINNRNFKTLKTDLATTAKRIEQIPCDRVVVSQSGIRSRGDVESLKDLPVDAIQVGTSLMLKKDLAAAVKELMS